MSAQPGWYPDPHERAELRWWDGQQWTGAEANPAAEAAAAARVSGAGPGEHPTAAPQAPAAAPAAPQAQVQTQTQAHAPAFAAAGAAPAGPSSSAGAGPGGIAVAPGTPPGTRPGTAPGAPPRPRKRRRLIMWTAIGAAAALAVTVAVVAGTGALRGGSGGAAAEVDREPRLVNGYLWEPVVELGPEERFEYPTNVPADELLAREDRDFFDTSGVVEIYADQDLTTSVTATLWDDVGRAQAGRSTMAVTPRVQSEAWVEFDAPEETPFEVTYASDNGHWLQQDTYYVVRYFDREGAELEHPVVTPVRSSLELPPAIEPTFTVGAEPGSAKLSWDPVPGADEQTEYLILKSYPGADPALGNSTNVIATTSETSWDSSDHPDPYGAKQNGALHLFSQTGSDLGLEVEGAGSGAGGAAAAVKFGVVAVTDEGFSPLKWVRGSSELGMLPHFIDLQMEIEHFPEQAGDLSDYPTWAPVTTLSGEVRQMPIQMDPESFREVLYDSGLDADGRPIVADAVGISYTVTGSTLEGKTASEVPAGETKESWREKLVGLMETFNERALAAQGKIGSRVMTSDETGVISVPEYQKITPSTREPEVEFPIFASNELTRYLAANMLAGEKSIDVSAFVGMPGMPTAGEAALEAQFQNPLLQQSIRAVQLHGDLVFVSYRGDAQEMLDQNRETQRRAEEIVAGLVTEGMSDLDRAAAVNQWLIDNLEYDFAALQVMEAGRLLKNDPMRQWNAQGVLVDGRAVCGGYADGFNLLARAAGLESVYVGGEVPSGGHAWNRVKIDGTWQSVDPTWNDTPGGEQQFFLFEEGADPDGTRTVATDYWIPLLYQAEYAAG